MKEESMRALVGHGKEDIRCDTVTDLEIESTREAINCPHPSILLAYRR
jgi:hypothetical protein